MIPYVQKRIPKWSETDSAQIVYTARFVDYAMDAIEGWFRDVLGVDWFLMNTELDMGTPFVKIEMEFKSPLTPHDELEVRVLVDRLGSSSFTFDVVGTRNSNQTSFESTFVCSLVKKSTMKSINIPGDLRQRAEDYVKACSKARPGRVVGV
jgi:YbgC/YbaW family acyl-CoA thioester hydrolase